MIREITTRVKNFVKREAQTIALKVKQLTNEFDCIICLINILENLTNEQREDAAVAAALAASSSPPKAYETLVAPYPVWAAMHACGVPRTGEKHRSVATGLFQDAFETCIDLNDSALYNYFKSTASLAAAHGQIKLHI